MGFSGLASVCAVGSGMARTQAGADGRQVGVHCTYMRMARGSVLALLHSMYTGNGHAGAVGAPQTLGDSLGAPHIELISSFRGPEAVPFPIGPESRASKANSRARRPQVRWEAGH